MGWGSGAGSPHHAWFCSWPGGALASQRESARLVGCVPRRPSVRTGPLMHGPSTGAPPDPAGPPLPRPGAGRHLPEGRQPGPGQPAALRQGLCHLLRQPDRSPLLRGRPGGEGVQVGLPVVGRSRWCTLPGCRLGLLHPLACPPTPPCLPCFPLGPVARVPGVKRGPERRPGGCHLSWPCLTALQQLPPNPSTPAAGHAGYSMERRQPACKSAWLDQPQHTTQRGVGNPLTRSLCCHPLPQLDAFQAAFAAATGGRTTNRQIMPVNDRTILLSEE